jgi:hypothetical protein
MFTFDRGCCIKRRKKCGRVGVFPTSDLGCGAKQENAFEQHHAITVRKEGFDPIHPTTSSEEKEVIRRCAKDGLPWLVLSLSV